GHGPSSSSENNLRASVASHRSVTEAGVNTEPRRGAPRLPMLVQSGYSKKHPLQRLKTAERRRDNPTAGSSVGRVAPAPLENQLPELSTNSNMSRYSILGATP